MNLPLAHPEARILDGMATLADATRARILAVLERRELTVSELRSVLQLPQSTVSRHLKTLGEGDWVRQRRDGTRRLYTMAADVLDPSSRGLWSLAREQMVRTPAAKEDARRADALLARRRERSRAFFAGAAGDWDRVRDELFGSRFHLRALPALVGGEPVVADLGCGTGAMSEALAPFAGRVIAVDESREMLEAARSRLEGQANVELRRGQLEALPLDDAVCDAATLILVLHHLPDPGRVLAEVRRVLRPGGRLLVVDMLPHDRQDYRQSMGHAWLGFEELHLRDLIRSADLELRRLRPLPPEAEAKGPGLFVLAAERPARGAVA